MQRADGKSKQGLIPGRKYNFHRRSTRHLFYSRPAALDVSRLGAQYFRFRRKRDNFHRNIGEPVNRLLEKKKFPRRALFTPTVKMFVTSNNSTSISNEIHCEHLFHDCTKLITKFHRTKYRSARTARFVGNYRFPSGSRFLNRNLKTPNLHKSGAAEPARIPELRRTVHLEISRSRAPRHCPNRKHWRQSVRVVDGDAERTAA